MQAISSLVAVERELSSRLAIVEGYVGALRTQRKELSDEVARLVGEEARLAAELDAVVSGRRYRLAQRLGRPLDAIRARFSRG